MITGEKKISELNISSKSKNCLLSEGYLKVSDIVFLSDYKLSKIKNINIECVNEIRKCIKEYLVIAWNDTSSDDIENETLLSYNLVDSTTIQFFIRDNAAIIYRIVIDNKPDKVTNSVCIIPETLGLYRVAGLAENSLNDVRRYNVKNLIIPYSLRIIGDEYIDLYSEFDDKKYPGRTKLKIWYSTKEYKLLNQKISNENGLFMNVIKGKEFYLSPEYFQINQFQKKNGYWKYPKDGMWILDEDDLFVRYTGNKSKVFVDNEKIASYAFFENEIEDIVFSSNTKNFKNSMVCDCQKLKTISFETMKYCEFEEECIVNCTKLKDVKMPNSFKCEGALFRSCTELGIIQNNGNLVYYYSPQKVIVLGENIETIGNGAFLDCENAKIIYIPDTVKRLFSNALIGTKISVVIISDNTSWDIALEVSRKLYIYSCKGSQVFNSALEANTYIKSHVYGIYSGGRFYIYQKNINTLKDAIEPSIDEDRLLLICEENMDEKDDEDVAILPYKW